MATITADVDVKTSTLESRKEALRGRNLGGYGGSTIGTNAKRGDALAVDIDAHDMSMDIVTAGSGSGDWRQRKAMNGMPSNGMGTIQPFTKPHSGLTVPTKLFHELKNLLREKDLQVRRVVFLGVFNILCSFILLVWCQSTNSMALTAYTFLTFFDFMTLVTCIITIWVSKQRPITVYTFGYERFEVLVVFASTMLAIFGAIFIMKESIERIFEPPEVHTGRLMVGAALGFVCHIVIAYGVENKAFIHVSGASRSSWLQEHFADMSRNFCAYVPGFDKMLLPRVNPFALIAFAGALALCFTDLMVDVNNYHIADTLAAISIALMTCGTMFPMSIYTGTILLQTTPGHVIGQLDKCLREASTLDGVLEFRNEHFWTLSFGRIAGSLHVRVRRDANEQMVLAHVANKVSHLVSILTVQVIKDDWTRLAPMTSFTNMSSTKLPPPAPLSSSIMSAMPNSNAYTPPSSPPNSQKTVPKMNFDYLKTPARASSTPYGTPVKDISFNSNFTPIAPSTTAKFTSEIGRTDYTSVPLMGLTRTGIPPAGQTSAGLGLKNTGVISVNSLGTSNLYAMGKTLSNQRPTSLR
ncbi:LOW QUALITY PROTEIN: zinc transporter 6-B-like [Amphiura filiformis]|uniref:LOW QUALITY PROTEIN: zinc transporter 6-B-like n=1 Tax=Amphiura filiformis TaxID=82378 RepID=UPI003B22691B